MNKYIYIYIQIVGLVSNQQTELLAPHSRNIHSQYDMMRHSQYILNTI